MAEEENIVPTLKERGVSCSKLKSMELHRIRLAQESRKLGFEATAKKDEEIGRSIKALRNKVCMLR